MADSVAPVGLTPDFDAAGFMVPPWVKYPELPSGSTGWRMGRGEEYWLRLVRWWAQQTPDVQLAMQVAYPPPAEWAKVYHALGPIKS
jgi:hypothetical protein